MKDKLALFIIGLLIGAVIATGAFYIYSKQTSKSCDCNNQTVQMNGETPPEMPGGQNGMEPPEKPSGENNESGQPPERPSDENSESGQPPEKQNDNNTQENN